MKKIIASLKMAAIGLVLAAAPAFANMPAMPSVDFSSAAISGVSGSASGYNTFSASTAQASNVVCVDVTKNGAQTLSLSDGSAQKIGNAGGVYAACGDASVVDSKGCTQFVSFANTDVAGLAGGFVGQSSSTALGTNSVTSSIGKDGASTDSQSLGFSTKSGFSTANYSAFGAISVNN